MSPQSRRLYQALLNANTAISASELAKQLNIVPNSIYRLAHPLVDMGLITRSKHYPYLFSACSTDEALSLFLIYQSNWFSNQFVKSDSITTPISFSFIQSRDALMNLSSEEVNKATESVKLLRSGAEFPADLLLAMVNAKKRGVTTKMLIQDYSAKNAGLVKNWKTNGILVRKTSLRHIRLMLYDSKAVYFMSYRHTESEKDLGIKINYSPFATILSQQFDQWWKNAEIL